MSNQASTIDIKSYRPERFQLDQYVVAQQRQSFGRKLTFSPAAPPELLDGLWMYPNHVLSEAIVYQRSKARVTGQIEFCETKYVVKYFSERNVIQRCRRWFSTSRAMKCWVVADQFLATGINTPQPIACLENRVGPFNRSSMFIYEFVPGLMMNTPKAKMADRRTGQSMRSAFDQLKGQMAELSVSHADPHGGNFIWTDDQELYVIDLDSVRFHQTERNLQHGLNSTFQMWEERYPKSMFAVPITQAA